MIIRHSRTLNRVSMRPHVDNFMADSVSHDNWRTRHEASPRTRLLVALAVGLIAALLLWLPVWVMHG